ncbi:thiamine pyrophosphate-binding protein [Halomonas daqingensis]|uniref:Thiamine pyrophosphate-binding protein n=1 Tax=Billgrantia desiderata TaxID=52021 RepID=A0ABS9B4N3_9GAMM|nr:thiamine pyrophosphate-binding protein [Halomonas desiderata]MCE8042365.1 thiamine pyrophosphate-binding protein [Halomonas desiderata]MCE8046940.1 thiamine pyrophosphate-binding protein [Halomonas desiderata]
MTRMSGGRAAVEALQANGVDTVFGLIGSATMEIFDALYDAKDIRFIGVRDERSGTHMADGYARASGKAGVFLAGQNGPGATNLVTAIAQAQAAYSPVIALAGSLATGHVYRDAFQEVDQQQLFTPITKKTYMVNSAGRVPELINEGFRNALSPRQGPVLLNLPRDVLAAEAEFGAIRGAMENSAHTAMRASAEQVAKAAKLLVAASRPLIIAGGGIKNRRAHEAVIELAESLNVPVATSPGHGDGMPFDHPLNAGQVGPRGNDVASHLAREADVILALGTRLGFNSTFYTYDNLNREAAIIQVEIEPTALGRFFPVEVAIWGDAPSVVQDLREKTRGSERDGGVWLAEFKEQRKRHLAALDETNDEQSPIRPETLFKALREVAPRDTMYTMDAGTLCLQATDKLAYWQPPALFTPLDFGLVGFSFSCGLGVKLACPERTVISLMGDGGFGMTVSELSTAVEYGINTVTVVMNNQCWGAEKAYQRDFFGERYIGANLQNPPYDKLAELYGARGFRVEHPGDLKAILEAAIACGKPAVVDVQVDPAALYSFRRDSFKHRAGAKA